MSPPLTPTHPSISPAAANAVTKFIEMNDDLDALQATNRRVFFEFLRTGPTLSRDEVEHLHAVGDLLAALGQAAVALKIAA